MRSGLPWLHAVTSSQNHSGQTNRSQKPTWRPACLNPAALTQGESCAAATFFQTSCKGSPGSRPEAAPTASSIVTFAPRTAAVRYGISSRTTFTNDDAEARLLRELGFATLLMFPLEVVGERWGLVELYRRAADRFAPDEVGRAQSLARIV